MGDTFSYFLGYTLSSRIKELWPFTRYPNWLLYGENYFERHGGKSVLLGRFIGPLRSIIPVIAGMMKMEHVQFLAANVLSGIAWAIVYITPGILIGTASHELSPEGATKLFLFVLALLVLVWVVSVAIKWLFLRANHFFRNVLHRFWTWLEYNRYFSHITKHFTPPNEGHHAGTATIILTILFMLASIALLMLWIALVDELGYFLDLPIYFFFQSVRTQALDIFFVGVNCFIHPYALSAFWTILLIHLIHTRNWRLMRYWTSLLITALLVTQIFSVWMLHFRLDDSPLFQTTFTQPSTSLVAATSLFGFLLMQLGHISLRSLARVLRLSWSILLALGGFAVLYLGDIWFTSVVMSYAIGILFALVHWLFYRRHIPRHPPSTRSLWFASGFFIAAGCMVITFQFKPMLIEHYPYPEQYELTSQAWWHQREPLLPLYTKNRFGHPNGVFNIQYLGSLNSLQQALEADGWQQRPNSFMRRVLLRAHYLTRNSGYPFKTPLYLNRKPVLVMTYNLSHDKSERKGLVLSFWRSNYRLRNHEDPIWLGSLQAYPQFQKGLLSLDTAKYTIAISAFSPFHYLLPALEGFEFNTLPLPPQSFQALPSNPYPLLLIVKEKQ